MNKFPNYLTKKFLEWQTELGARKTLEEFADYLNVSRPLLSFWMNGKRIPNAENLENISNILGNEIYDALDLPRPNPHLQKLNRVWEFLPEEIQERISREAESYEAQNISKRVQTISKRRKTSSNK
jgi:transcriptional regulator with XRE-family HTH domain